MLENNKKGRAISDDDMNGVNGGILLGNDFSLLGDDLVLRSTDGKKKAKPAVYDGTGFKAEHADLKGLGSLDGTRVVSGGPGTGGDVSGGFVSGKC